MNHKQRILEEYTDLLIKKTKLDSFLDTPVDLPKEEIELLNKQLAVMNEYCCILFSRLSLELTK